MAYRKILIFLFLILLLPDLAGIIQIVIHFNFINLIYLLIYF